MIINTHKEQMNTTYSQHVCLPPTFKSVTLLNNPPRFEQKAILELFIDADHPLKPKHPYLR